jgi:hypothetical protein
MGRDKTDRAPLEYATGPSCRAPAGRRKKTTKRGPAKQHIILLVASV